MYKLTRILQSYFFITKSKKGSNNKVVLVRHSNISLISLSPQMCINLENDKVGFYYSVILAKCLL